MYFHKVSFKTFASKSTCQAQVVINFSSRKSTLMYSNLISNFTCLSSSDMLVFFCSLIFAMAAGITAFLLFSSNGIKDFKTRFFCKNRIPQLPILTDDGSFVDSKEDLEAHLEVLESKLQEKVSEIEMSKTRVQDAKQSMERLHSTQFQVKKYYIKLREEIKKSEDDCKNLQEQIDDYRRRRAELDQEMKKNEEYYKSLLDAVGSNDSLDTHQSSKLSMNSGSSSTTSFHDSSSYVYLEEKPAVEKIEPLPECPESEIETSKDAKTEEVASVSKHNSKCSMSDDNVPSLERKSSNINREKDEKDEQEVSKDTCKRASTPQKKSSQHSLTRPASPTTARGQKDASKRDQKELTKTESEPKGLKNCDLLPHKLSGCGIQKLKVKSLKGEICCCGCSKCPGTCNLARCIKLGFLKPKDILSVEVADHVDVLTGKIVCNHNYAHKPHIPLDSQAKRPLTPRNTGRFS